MRYLQHYTVTSQRNNSRGAPRWKPIVAQNGDQQERWTWKSYGPNLLQPGWGRLRAQATGEWMEGSQGMRNDREPARGRRWDHPAAEAETWRAQSETSGEHRPARWDQAEKVAELTAALAGAGLAVAQAIEILTHIHW